MKSLSFFQKHYKSPSNGTLETTSQNINGEAVVVVTPKDSLE
jgi:hypothetical protein